MIQCIRRDDTDLLDAWGIAAPRRNGATFAVLDPQQRRVAEVPLEQVARDGQLDPARLAAFLRTHGIALPDAEDVLASACREAAGAGKRVLLQLGGPHCGHCIRLARYLESRQELIAKDYVVVKLDTRMPRASDVIGKLRKKAKGPIPWTAILSAEGRVLASGDGPQGNIGYPRTTPAKAHFQEMLRTTSQRLTAAEIDALVTGLEGE